VRLVNLSHVNDPARTSLYPGDPEFRLTAVRSIAVDGFALQLAEQGEHTGTHWGAPAHFHAGEPAADELDPHDLFRPAVRLDVREQCAADPDYGVTVADLRAFERRHGRIPAEAAVILWTGWDARWGTPAYPNLDGDGVVHQPGFTVEAVRWLLRTGRLGRRGALGTDTFGPDRGVDGGYPVSLALYREHRISLECLANLRALPATGAWILAGGTINRHGSGSPATIYALLPPP
jgi:kynurenine formamidase